MWRNVITALADSGSRALPGPAGFGDSPPDQPEHANAHEGGGETSPRARPRAGRAHRPRLGGLIGLRWACEHPERHRRARHIQHRLLPRRQVHGIARAHAHRRRGRANGPHHGSRRIHAHARHHLDRDRRHTTDQYWKTFETQDSSPASWTSTRSGDFEKLKPYEGQLSALGVPTLILWGENDLFAPIAGAHRFQREIPDAKLVVLKGAGHFVYADEPSRCAREVAGSLAAKGV